MRPPATMALGSDMRRVSITGADPETGEVMVRDTNGLEFTLLGTTRPKGTGFPAPGEIWLAQRSGPAWSLRTQIGATPPPIITGGVEVGSPEAATLAALDSLGLIRNHTVPGSGGGGGITEADVRALIATIPISGLAAAVSGISMGSHQINDLAAPTVGTDAANRTYVDAGDTASHAYTDAAVASIVLGDADSYTFIQSASSSTWDVVHPLSFVPNVLVVDSAGTSVWGDVTILSLSHLTISFSAPFSGVAYLS